MVYLVSQSPCAGANESLVPPPHVPDVLDHLPPRVSSPIKDVLLGKLKIKLERTTLDEVKKTVGTGVMDHGLDEGTAQTWICYSITSGAIPERIWFISGDEMQPGNETGAVYAIMNTEQTRPSSHCPELPQQFRPVSFSNSLWLGANRERFRRLFGKPSAKVGEWEYYSYYRAPNRLGYDLLAYLGVRIIKGTIVSIFEWQVTTSGNTP